MNRAEQNASRRAHVIQEALSWIGTPYRHQASQKGQGADCLGFVRGVYRSVVGPDKAQVPPYPRRAHDREEHLLIAATEHLRAIDHPQAGDVLLFRMRRSLPIRHCGILVADDLFIHAYEGQAVVSTALSSFWRTRINASFSFPEAP